MQTVTTIGFDIAKSVFQVHGVDAAGNVVVRRQLKRRQVLAFFEKLPSCLIGIEACASSHHWSRELQGLGHTVRLISGAMKPRTASLPCRVVGGPRADAVGHLARLGSRVPQPRSNEQADFALPKFATLALKNNA